MSKRESTLNQVIPALPPDQAAMNDTVEGFFDEWFHVQKSGGIVRVNITGEIGCVRPWRELVAQVEGATDIRILINSPGGKVDDGVELFHALNNRVSETTITGRCFSAALPIALAGKKIRMERHARILCHAPHSWIYGDADQMILAARRLKKYSAYLKKIIMERTEQPETVVAGWLNGADVYFSAEQAVAYGLVDEIFDAPKSEPCETPVATADAGTVQSSGMTEDEQFALDVLRALPRLTVHNRQSFLREVCASLFYNTDVENNYEQKK